MVLEKCVEVVYFKDMGNGNGFSKFKERGVVARIDEGNLVLKGRFSKLMDIRVVCAGTNDGEICPCFNEDIQISEMNGDSTIVLNCGGCVLRRCKILLG